MKRQRPGRRERKPSRRRRAFGMLIALSVISMTLGICYAVLRSQTTAYLIAANTSGRDRARQAARSGLLAAIRRMHDSDWAGADTGYQANLDADTWYQAQYVTGDAALTAGHVDEWLYPYRVTVTSTGHCRQNNGPDAVETASAVVQLAPRMLSALPPGWDDAMQCTALHWSDLPMTFEPPSRINGRLRSQGCLKLARACPLERHRPFRGSIDEVALWSKALTGTQIFLANANCRAGQLPSAYDSLGPDVWWRLNEESGTTAEESMAGAHGQYRGPLLGKVSSPGEVDNKAPLFDGHNDLVSMRNVGSGSRGTVFAWFRDDAPGDFTESCIVSRAEGVSDNDYGWSLSVISDAGSRRLKLTMRISGWPHEIVSSQTVTPGQWHFAAATFDGNWIRLFQDGVQVGDRYDSGSITHPSDAVLLIGDNSPGSGRAAWMRGLREMSDSGTDWRPLTGPLEMPLSQTASEDHDLVVEGLQAPYLDLAINTEPPAAHPGWITTYQLYPGGKTYDAEVLDGYYESATLAPDSRNNPLGVCLRGADLVFGSNVSFQGVLINVGFSDLILAGANITLTPVALPPLDGQSQGLQLPVAVIQDDIRVYDHAQVSIQGLLMAWDHFQLHPGASDTRVDFSGKLLTQQIVLHGRTEWPNGQNDYSGDLDWWSDRLARWRRDVANGSPRTLPEWLSSNENLSSAPTLNLKDDPTAAGYHWHPWNGPLVVPHPDDSGLRWDIVRWVEP